MSSRPDLRKEDVHDRVHMRSLKILPLQPNICLLKQKKMYMIEYMKSLKMLPHKPENISLEKEVNM